MSKYRYLFIILFFISCDSNQDHKEEWPIDFEELIVLHCKSIELKNARFALADSLRFTQDSIMVNEKLGKDVSLFKAQLDHLELRKNVLKEESYTLSDTIEHRMKRVIRELSQEEKRVFNDSLLARTTSMGCL